jgi:transposase
MAFAATVPDPSAFRSGREFAAWLGPTPRQSSSGGKKRLGGIDLGAEMVRAGFAWAFVKYSTV